MSKKTINVNDPDVRREITERQAALEYEARVRHASGVVKRSVGGRGVAAADPSLNRRVAFVNDMLEVRKGQKKPYLGAQNRYWTALKAQQKAKHG